MQVKRSGRVAGIARCTTVGRADPGLGLEAQEAKNLGLIEAVL